MRKVFGLAVAAIVALSACNRTDDNAPKMIDGVEYGTEFVAGVNIGTAAIGVTEEPLGAGGETTTGIPHGEEELISENAVVFLQIKDNTEDGKIIGRGYWRVDKVPNDLKVILKHGHSYESEATLFNDPQNAEFINVEGITYIVGKPFNENFTEGIGEGIANLSNPQMAKRPTCLRYYVKSTYVAKFEENANIPVKMECVTLKTTYNFSNFSKQSGHKIKTTLFSTIADSEEEKNYIDEFVNENLTTDPQENWHETCGNGKLNNTSLCNKISAVYNDGAGMTNTKVKSYAENAELELKPGYNYIINVDYGIEAGLNITVDKTTLDDGGTIDLK